MPRSLEEFLSLDGAVSLLCEIDPVEGSRFLEIDSNLSISHQTLSDRLTEARELNLVEREAVSGERGTTHKYVLTPKGRILNKMIGIVGADSAYENYIKSRDQYQERSEIFQQWISNTDKSHFDDNGVFSVPPVENIPTESEDEEE